MPFELIKTNIKERKETGSGQTQVLVEGDVIVPDIKSDIMELMKVQGNCYLTEEKPLEDKVVLRFFNRSLSSLRLSNTSSTTIRSLPAQSELNWLRKSSLVLKVTLF